MLARISHTVRAGTVNDAAEGEFGGGSARGSSTTGRCIGHEGRAMRGQTPSEAFLVGARSLQGATPQCLPGEKHLNPYLRSVASACAAVRAGAATVTVAGKELGLLSATTLAFGRLCAALRRHPRLLLRLLATARRSQALASLR